MLMQQQDVAFNRENSSSGKAAQKLTYFLERGSYLIRRKKSAHVKSRCGRPFPPDETEAKVRIPPTLAAQYQIGANKKNGNRQPCKHRRALTWKSRRIGERFCPKNIDIAKDIGRMELKNMIENWLGGWRHYVAQEMCNEPRKDGNAGADD